jgi:hypothetical protein
MSLINDLKTFVLALALGVVMTVSINYVVVNYTKGPAPVQAAAHTDAYEQNDGSYESPKPVQKTDTSSSNSGAYY